MTLPDQSNVAIRWLRELRVALAGAIETGTCAYGPEGCDPQGGELVACAVCGEPVCDFHGDYPSDEAYAEGDWRCPNCSPALDEER